MALRKIPFENIVGKGENDGNQHFLIFPTVSCTLSKKEIINLETFNLSSVNAFSFVKAKILSFGKELGFSGRGGVGLGGGKEEFRDQFYQTKKFRILCRETQGKHG